MYPTLFHFGHLTLPTFGVLAAIGLMVALGLSERTARLAGVDSAKLWDAGIFAVIAAFVLSRVLLGIFYWKSFRAFPVLLLTVPSLTALGLLLTLFATAAWLWLRGIPILGALNAWAPGAAIVWACLALGHFAEGSDPGMPSQLRWAMAQVPGETARLHPVALYTALFALGLAGWTYGLLRSCRPAAAYGLMGAGAGQFAISFLRQPGAPGWMDLDLLQWAALGMIGAGLLLRLVAPATME